MMTRLIFPVLLLTVGVLSGCNGESPSPASASSPPPSPLRTVQPHHPMENVGLRGQPVPRDSCPVVRSLSNGAVGNPEPSVAIFEPDSFLICQSGRVPVIKADTLGFSKIEQAAEMHDPIKTPNVCLGYGDVTRSIVAQTSSGSFQVYLPEDGCGHYQGAIKKAIHSAWPEG